MADLLFDDTYTGPRWRYGLQHRPISSYFGMASLPAPILFTHRPSDDPRFPHGTAEWPCQIPADQAAQLGLVELSHVSGDPTPAV